MNHADHWPFRNPLLSHRSTARCIHGRLPGLRPQPGARGSRQEPQRTVAGVLLDLLRRTQMVQMARTAVGLLAPLRCRNPVCQNHRRLQVQSATTSPGRWVHLRVQVVNRNDLLEAKSVPTTIAWHTALRLKHLTARVKRLSHRLGLHRLRNRRGMLLRRRQQGQCPLVPQIAGTKSVRVHQAVQALHHQVQLRLGDADAVGQRPA